MTACSNDDDTSSRNNTSECAVKNSETAGPFPTFPTLTPSALVRTNIVGDKTGIPLNITITVQNTNNSCTVLQCAIVDIWHYDKDGYYYQYVGTAMQTLTELCGNSVQKWKEVEEVSVRALEKRIALWNAIEEQMEMRLEMV